MQTLEYKDPSMIMMMMLTYNGLQYEDKTISYTSRKDESTVVSIEINTSQKDINKIYYQYK
jgi:hypothetical protein